MSLKRILDSFQQGRKEAKVWFDDDAPVVRSMPLPSCLELVSYCAGYLSQPQAVYEIAKFFISGEWKGSQGISEEELKEYDKQKEYTQTNINH